MKNLINIEEVCEIAKVSKPTIYRRVKETDFPKPKKVARVTARGPKTVNRWERGEVMGWLLKGNDPTWFTQPIKHIREECEKLDKIPLTREEIAPQLKPRLTALFSHVDMPVDERARLMDGDSEFYDLEPIEMPKKKKSYVVQAVVGAVLAGLAYMFFYG